MLIATYLMLGMTLGTTMPSRESSPLRELQNEAPSFIAANLNQNGNSISGYIFDSSRRPVSQIYVELQNDYYQTLSRARTDGSGHFSFTNLSAGNFKVKVLASGTNFVEQVQDVSIINFERRTAAGPGIRGRESREINFTLITRTENTASASLSSPGVVFVQEVPATAKKTFEKAVQDLDNGKREEAALAELKQAIDIFPKYYLALERLGTEYVKRGQYEPARAVLTTAIEVHPRGYQSLQMLGVALYNLKQLSAAVEMLNRALGVAPNSINAQLWLGIALKQSGKLDQAETHLKQANALAKNQLPEAHWQLALLYHQLKRNKEAANELELFLKLQPDSRDVERIKKLIKQLREMPG